MTGDSLTPEQPPRTGTGGPESASGPRVGTERGSGVPCTPQAGAQSLDGSGSARVGLNWLAVIPAFAALGEAAENAAQGLADVRAALDAAT